MKLCERTATGLLKKASILCNTTLSVEFLGNGSGELYSTLANSLILGYFQ